MPTSLAADCCVLSEEEGAGKFTCEQVRAYTICVHNAYACLYLFQECAQVYTCEERVYAFS